MTNIFSVEPMCMTWSNQEEFEETKW